MANVKPFKGYRYNIDKIEDPGKVVSPPYYNLKQEVKDSLYEMSKYNSFIFFSGITFVDYNDS